LNTNTDFHFNWAKEIKHLLDIHGFSYVWYNNQNLNINKCIKEFIERVNSQYLQNLYSVVESSSKLSVYKSIKLNYEHDDYLDILFVRKLRHCYAQLRAGSFSL
jgi:hypothetical protein